MIYPFLADTVVVIHLIFILFVGVGGFLVLRWPRLIFAHLPAAIWGAIIEFTSGTCPLTPLEKLLRARAGQPVYRGGFMENYLIPILYPPGLTREVQLFIGAAVVLVNTVIYWQVIHGRPKITTMRH